MIASLMDMTPLLVPPTSGAAPSTSTMTTSTHPVLGILVSSSSQESLDHLEVALLACIDEAFRSRLQK